MSEAPPVPTKIERHHANNLLHILKPEIERAQALLEAARVLQAIVNQRPPAEQPPPKPKPKPARKAKA